MKAVMPSVPPEVLAFRRRTGADRWDEMWDGVLHMPPSPNVEHQDLEFLIEQWLRQHWAVLSGGKVYHQVNVARAGGWDRDYRIPDLVLLLPERFHVDRNVYFEGGPNVVVEIESQDDETWAKMPFYREVGVQEAWVIHRDSKLPRIVVFEGATRPRDAATSAKVRVQTSPATDLGASTVQEVAVVDGWIRSPLCEVEMRCSEDRRLEIRLARDRERTWQCLPEVARKA